jgi:hypothetical protein
MTSASSEVKLKRFLHYGREMALYEPGDRYTNNYFEPNNVTSIEAMIADGKETEPVAHIVKVQCVVLCLFYLSFNAHQNCIGDSWSCFHVQKLEQGNVLQLTED